jgi:hypothetical protein
MSTTQPATSGVFSPLSDGPIRTDRQFDLQNLTDEEREVVTAEEFVIFGRANIEQWNDPAPGEEQIYIEVDALEERLDQLLALNNLSRRHQDVKVGEFKREHTLDDETTVHLDSGQTLRFEAGDTLRSEVIREGEPLPDGSGEAHEDALWLVANVYGRNDTEGSLMSQETRLGAYYGHLDGFSVTVQRREYDPTDDGAVISEVDFLAVTIGEDELIKNKGSTFGVAEFQSLFGHGRGPATDDAGTTPSRGRETAEVAAWLRGKVTMNIFQNLFSQSEDGLVRETIRTARQNDDLSLEAAAAEVAGNDNADHIHTQAAERLESIADRVADLDEQAMDREDLAAEVADELGMDKEEAMALLDEAEAAADMVDDVPDGEGDYEDEDEDDMDGQGVDPEMVQQAVDDRVGDLAEIDAEAVVTAEDLDDRLSEIESQLDALDSLDTDSVVTEGDLNERLSAIESQLDDALDGLGADIADSLESQMNTGSTPDPAGGNAATETDLKSELDGVVDGMTWGDS